MHCTFCNFVAAMPTQWSLMLGPGPKPMTCNHVMTCVVAPNVRAVVGAVNSAINHGYAYVSYQRA